MRRPVDRDLRQLDRLAVETSLDVVGRVRDADLNRPTPCSEWALGDLLAHMTVQHKGFSAASRGSGADLQQWRPVHSSDPVGAYRAAAQEVLAAFAADGVLERSFVLPEISTQVEFPAARAIGFHFIDYVVHGWDVASALGEKYELDDELAPAALRIAGLVPDGPQRSQPNAAFRPSMPSPVDGSAPLERILRALGRSPQWPN